MNLKIFISNPLMLKLASAFVEEPIKQLKNASILNCFMGFCLKLKKGFRISHLVLIATDLNGIFLKMRFVLKSFVVLLHQYP
ncbi:hypothetical protein SAMN04487989_1095 [Bizionia echini]|uniref:Uncharacterized protein n=1 Tax=Bizionia echini TaxID=649333 RepID=A0A1I5DLS2_9FLAO|nr:hypothetical protein SAMN04487989_1095 [Bizionia echini]